MPFKFVSGESSRIRQHALYRICCLGPRAVASLWWARGPHGWDVRHFTGAGRGTGGIALGVSSNRTQNGSRDCEEPRECGEPLRLSVPPDSRS
jgi:hypothetical protein